VWSLAATQKAALLALFGGVVCVGLSAVAVCVGVALGAAATDLFRVSNRQLSHL
jgi:2-phosphoglycerate kinase